MAEDLGGVGVGEQQSCPAALRLARNVCGPASSLGACTLRLPRQGRGSRRPRHPLQPAWIPHAARGPPGIASSAAAAGHGIVNESNDIIPNRRQELPGSDLHGPSKEILVNCALPNGSRRSRFFRSGCNTAEREALRQCSPPNPSSLVVREQTKIMRRCPRDRPQVVSRQSRSLGLPPP